MTRQTIKTECISCRGTGLYRGFAEPKGTAVVCLEYNGTGYKEIGYTPFVVRKTRTDIHIVRRSHGSFMGAGVGPVGGGITYQEFQQGKIPS